MPFLPAAHAMSCLRREPDGRTIFRPDKDDTGYVVPDRETEERIVRGLKRLRWAELAACTLGAAAALGALVLLPATGIEASKGAFVGICAVVFFAIYGMVVYARERLARGLPSATSPDQTVASWHDKAPAWLWLAFAAVVVAAIAASIWWGKLTPLKSLV